MRLSGWNYGECGVGEKTQGFTRNEEKRKNILL
jgi:hypothetical protein